MKKITKNSVVSVKFNAKRTLCTVLSLILLAIFLNSCQQEEDNIVQPSDVPEYPLLADPSNLTLVTISGSDRKVKLTWRDNSTNETGFVIERKTGDAKSTVYQEIGRTGNNSTFFVDSSDVSINQTIYYRVFAVGNHLISAGYSNEVARETALSAPTLMYADSLIESGVTLTWQDNSDWETGYLVERSSGSNYNYTTVATLPANSKRFKHNTAITPNTEYYYRVCALKDSVRSPYCQENILLHFYGPSSLTATKLTTTSYKLSWYYSNSTSYNELGYKIYQSINGGEYSLLTTTTTPDVMEYTISNLDPAKYYSYKVLAYTANSESDLSETTAISMDYSEGFENGQISSSWINSSTYPWTVSTVLPGEGSYSIKSGSIPHSQSTTISKTIYAEGYVTVSFKYKTSTEYYYDKLKFEINNNYQYTEEWYGENGWTTYTRTFYASGSTTLSWTYSKNSNSVSGSDAVWIDEIQVVKSYK